MFNFKAPTNNTLDDFWRLIWQEHPPTIVMVTNLVEREKVLVYTWYIDTMFIVACYMNLLAKVCKILAKHNWRIPNNWTLQHFDGRRANVCRLCHQKIASGGKVHPNEETYLITHICRSLTHLSTPTQ